MGIESQTTTVMEIPSSTFLDHWQGHRRLTRRLIEAFPEDKIFTYSIGGMRPFSDMVIEFLGMAIPGIRGMVTGVWKGNEWPRPTTKAELLQHWDEATAEFKQVRVLHLGYVQPWRQVLRHQASVERFVACGDGGVDGEHGVAADLLEGGRGTE